MEMKTMLQRKLSEITITIADNLQQKWGKMDNITANSTLDTLKRALVAIYELPLPEKWNQTRSICTNSTPTVETLQRVSFAAWDLCVSLFQQAYLLYQKRDGFIHSWFDGAQMYLESEYLQQKWNHIDAQYKVTETAVNVFSQFHSAVENFSGYVIRTFNNILPPETRDDQIRRWFYIAVACLGLLVLFRCLIGICWCFGSVISYLFMFISSVLRFLFRCISSIVKLCFCPVPAFFRCFWFGGKTAVKMMKAPGKPAVMIARAVFEADPQGYFSNLRGRR